MEAARYYFEEAIRLTQHYGAHYSLALMLKLHPYLLSSTYDYGGNAMDGEELGLAHYAYSHMCMAQTSYLEFMKGKKEGAAFEHCDGSNRDGVDYKLEIRR